MNDHDLDAIVANILVNTDGEDPWVVARTIVRAILSELGQEVDGAASGPCSYCGRVDPDGTWPTPCPSDDCPSHDKED